MPRPGALACSFVHSTEIKGSSVPWLLSTENRPCFHPFLSQSLSKQLEQCRAQWLSSPCPSAWAPSSSFPFLLAGHCGFKEVCLDYYPHSAEKQDIHINFNSWKLIFSSLLFRALCLVSEPLTLAYLALVAARFENLVSQSKIGIYTVVYVTLREF